MDKRDGGRRTWNSKEARSISHTRVNWTRSSHQSLATIWSRTNQFRVSYERLRLIRIDAQTSDKQNLQHDMPTQKDVREYRQEGEQAKAGQQDERWRWWRRRLEQYLRLCDVDGLLEENRRKIGQSLSLPSQSARARQRKLEQADHVGLEGDGGAVELNGFRDVLEVFEFVLLVSAVDVLLSLSAMVHEGRGEVDGGFVGVDLER